MALKFLNKKGWHTGSLRNIENVWKAEQKHEAEQKKLEELRKQIVEEREKSEFRLLQEQAGLVPKQERLDFLYDSGLSVGKGSSSSDGGFKAFEALPKTDPSSSSAKQQQPSVPGALFEEKPQSANDAWRKLHSDPLLLIRQREQDALARVKNNPIQMAMIRKSVEEKKSKDKKSESRNVREKHHHKKPKHQRHSSSEGNADSKNVAGEGERRRDHKSSKHDYRSDKLPSSLERDSRRDYKSSKHDGRSDKLPSSLERDSRRDHKSSKHDDCSDKLPPSSEREARREHKSAKHDEHSDKLPPSSERGSRDWNTLRKSNRDGDVMHKDQPSHARLDWTLESGETRDGIKRNHDKSQRGRYHSEGGRMDSETAGRKGRDGRRTVKLSEEERAARLQEMQIDAELHEEQRWKRLKKAEENDAKEAVVPSSGRNFLDAAQKKVYGAEKGGSSTIEESVRRRTHYSQRRSEAGEGNAFRR